MTFEECILKEFGLDVSDGAIYSVPTYKKVWDAATAAERQRCREIALDVGEEGLSDLWFTCADKIANEIGK